MDLAPATVDAFAAAGLEISTLGSKGRGVLARRQLRCGEVLLRERGLRGRTMEELSTEVLGSDEAREAARGLFAGPLHQLRDGLPPGKEDDEAWLDVYAKVRYNCFAVDGVSVLLPHVALFNHSCWPNAALFPRADGEMALVVVAREGVAVGDEVVTCYDSELLLAPGDWRRRQLMQSWNFFCRCQRCMHEGEGAGSESQLGDNFEALAGTETLSSLWLFARRGEVMQQPGLDGGLRRRLFHAQLSAACRLLPYLHPKLLDVFERIKDLCGSSPEREHCDRMQEFYCSLSSGDEPTWEF